MSDQLLTWGRRYLVCPPEHFDVVYSINPWMNTSVPVDAAKARAQWTAFVQALVDAGAEVETIEPDPSLPDMVFTANAGVVVGDRFVPSRMRHKQRQGEQLHFVRWFSERGYRIAELPVAGDVLQEGAGDALPYAGALIAGQRTRSTERGWRELGRALGAPTVALELHDPRYYHVDLTFCPLDAQRAMVAPFAWTVPGWEAVRSLVQEPLVLRPDELAAFTANSVVVDRTVILPACSRRVARELERAGFEPVVVELGEFLKAGGGARCLTLPLDVDPAAVGAPSQIDVPADASIELSTPSGAEAIELAERFGAHNYHPLPVSIARGEGAWVFDAAGRSYLDALAAYSALNFGHRHPRLIAAAQRQLELVTLTSRAFHNDQLGPFCRELAELCGMERVLPMNTGAEAVETAIKTARKWGYQVKGVPADRATIVVCTGNFHGRTTTIVSFSDDPVARDDFGPYTPGFVEVPFGDAAALEAALRDETVVAFLVEPIQGEAGVIVPPAGYLGRARELTRQAGVLLIADEIQAGLGRTGRTFACEAEQVVPDLYVLGKALGGGIMPLSAVVGFDATLGLFKPGEHGSTFGGNPLACAVGREVLALLREGHYQQRAAELGDRFAETLRGAGLPGVAQVRGRGLWFGIELAPGFPPARVVCERLLEERVLAKDTHESCVRLAPPLTVSEAELDFVLSALKRALDRVASSAARAA